VSIDLAIEFTTPLIVVHRHECGYARAVWTFSLGDYNFRGENMAATMGVGSYATCSVAWKDAGGNIVKVDGPTDWKSSDTAICQATVASGNPLICNLYAPGKIGKVTVQATADADLGEGVQKVTSSLDVEVISGEAVGGEITFTQSPAQGNPPPSKTSAPPPRGR